MDFGGLVVDTIPVMGYKKPNSVAHQQPYQPALIAVPNNA